MAHSLSAPVFCDRLTSVPPTTWACAGRLARRKAAETTRAGRVRSEAKVFFLIGRLPFLFRLCLRPETALLRPGRLFGRGELTVLVVVVLLPLRETDLH